MKRDRVARDVVKGLKQIIGRLQSRPGQVIKDKSKYSRKEKHKKGKHHDTYQMMLPIYVFRSVWSNEDYDDLEAVGGFIHNPCEDILFAIYPSAILYEGQDL